MTSRQIEMTWRCTSCSERNLGRFKVCQTCKNPKDGSEEYEMPADPSSAASVTEASLLRMALSGPDWRCAYCESDQRAPDRSCANCGASALEGEEATERETRAAVQKPEGGVVSFGGLPMAALEKAAEDGHAPSETELADAHEARRNRRTSWLVGLGSVGLAFTVLAGLVWNHNRPKDFEARVSSVSWERSVDVERYFPKHFEGFKEAMPEGASAVTSLGRRFHHTEAVPDGFRTERYSVQVSDGYRTESYTEQVSCGQTCSGSERSCSEKCTSNKNGFATCRQVCTGGGRTCRTKYCSERRTKQVPKTKTEWRTREVQQYRDVPRDAEAFSWVAWVWELNRSLRASGTDVTVRWPETKAPEALGPGEQERETRTERYLASFEYDDGQRLTLQPATEAEFVKFAPQSKHRLHTEQGVFTLDGVVVTPVR